MSDYFLGEIRMFGFDWAPRGWALCQGQTMPLQQNTALFALLGVQYGGNGTTNFHLPDLRGRAPFGQGPGTAGGSSYVTGSSGGTETVTLTAQQLPPHTHTLGAVAEAGSTPAVTENYLATVHADAAGHDHAIYAPLSNPAVLNASTIAASPAATAHANMQPYIVMNFCISLAGIFPSRQ